MPEEYARITTCSVLANKIKLKSFQECNRHKDCSRSLCPSKKFKEIKKNL